MSRSLKVSHGKMTIAIHWSFALVVFGMLGLGVYMVELTYYDDWYKSAPHIHKGIGFILAVLLTIRIFWRVAKGAPEAVPEVKVWEAKAAQVVHIVLYLIPLILIISGFLISTADGRSIDIFNWFEIPAVLPASKGMEDTAGLIHQWLAYSLGTIAVFHALAALKHHFVNKDQTLIRMLNP